MLPAAVQHSCCAYSCVNSRRCSMPKHYLCTCSAWDGARKQLGRWNWSSNCEALLRMANTLPKATKEW